tara:strand:+ start:74 stop:409 length:336 start_codon:yes stop_codon:yes gene_type:complete
MSIKELTQENDALKANNIILKEALVALYDGGWDEDHAGLIDNQVKIALESTPAQCINSIKADAINGFFGYLISEGVGSDNGVDPVIDDYLLEDLLIPLKEYYISKIESHNG